jgi:hypothetical protein
LHSVLRASAASDAIVVLLADDSSLGFGCPCAIVCSLAPATIMGTPMAWAGASGSHRQHDTETLSRPSRHASPSTVNIGLHIGFITTHRQASSGCNALSKFARRFELDVPPALRALHPSCPNLTQPSSMVFPRSHRQLGRGDTSFLLPGPLVQQYARCGPTTRFCPITRERGLSPQLQPGCCCSTLPISTTTAAFDR